MYIILEWPTYEMALQGHTSGSIGLHENVPAQGEMDHVRARSGVPVSAAVHTRNHRGKTGDL